MISSECRRRVVVGTVAPTHSFEDRHGLDLEGLVTPFESLCPLLATTFIIIVIRRSRQSSSSDAATEERSQFEVKNCLHSR
jgi:hypothetical protein